MVGVELLKSFCVFTLIGLVAAKLNVNKLNVTALHKPDISSSFDKAQPFWDPDFCNDFEDEDAFPHPDSCEEFLICWGGELWEMICDEGQLFDPIDSVCDDADYVECLDDPWGPDPDPDSECPPPGSSEVRFLPSIYCDEFYICINGQPILLQCRAGQHWNIEEGKRVKFQILFKNSR
jgi:Chitin binding Peritrophin-A domain